MHDEPRVDCEFSRALDRGGVSHSPARAAARETTSRAPRSRVTRHRERVARNPGSLARASRRTRPRDRALVDANRISQSGAREFDDEFVPWRQPAGLPAGAPPRRRRSPASSARSSASRRTKPAARTRRPRATRRTTTAPREDARGGGGARVPPSSGASSVDGAAADAHQTRAPHGSLTGTWDVGSSRYNSSVPPSDDERGGGGLGGGGGDAGSVYSLSDASELSAAPGYRPACDKYTAAATRADSVAYTLEQHRLQLEATIRSIDNAQAAAAGGRARRRDGAPGGRGRRDARGGADDDGAWACLIFSAPRPRRGRVPTDPIPARRRARGRGGGGGEGRMEGGEEPYTFMGCCGGRS